MKKNKLILLGSLSTSFIPAVSVMSAKCGHETKNAERLEQEKQLKDEKRVSEIQDIWNILALSKKYNIKADGTIDHATLIKNFENEFKRPKSKLFEESYKAYKIYALEQIAKDEYYFVNKVNDWNKNNIFNDNPFNWLSTKEFPGETNKDDFIKIWSVDSTGIRKEINNMLLVKAYFEISELKDLQTIANNIEEAKKKENEKDKDKDKDKDKNKEKDKKEEKKDKTQKFEYYENGKDAKFGLNHYYLNKYAFENKYIQLWNRLFSDKNTSNDIFTKPEIKNTISTLEDYNAFFKDTAEEGKKIKEWEILSSNKDIESKLSGYIGFQKDPGSYGLSWDEGDNKKRTDSAQNYGMYDPLNQILFSFKELQEGKVKSSVPTADKNGKLTVTYINQIVPNGIKTKLPKKDDYLKGKEVEDKDKKEVDVLSFENTIYKGNLDLLSYMFYTKDSANLVTKATETFAHLGIKIKINKDIKPLYDLLKNKVWVEK
ncbi:HinT-interacting membrane complex lipoprotein P60 [Mycoplasmopsis primatum]|uniref:HinT-interacting membrane complex lipoprotein P60 n=1 Tax=Mycoplasmopsis primatum TaxID=55604 RepID=UPI000494DE1B|nr:hypothetical protein [Mycoplasmopsis primatum]